MGGSRGHVETWPTASRRSESRPTPAQRLRGTRRHRFPRKPQWQLDCERREAEEEARRRERHLRQKARYRAEEAARAEKLRASARTVSHGQAAKRLSFLLFARLDPWMLDSRRPSSPPLKLFHDSGLVRPLAVQEQLPALARHSGELGNCFL